MLHPATVVSHPFAKNAKGWGTEACLSAFIVAFVSCAIVIVADPVLEDRPLCIGLTQEN
jgi:diacylglycerol kinase